MADTIPYEYEARFIYGEQTRCALISFKGRVEYIGPFPDKGKAEDAAKAWLRKKGWTGGTLLSRN